MYKTQIENIVLSDNELNFVFFALLDTKNVKRNLLQKFANVTVFKNLKN